MTVGFKCPICKSGPVWRKGKTPTVKGPKLRYICYGCGHSFYKPVEHKSKKKS